MGELLTESHNHYAVVEKAISYIRENADKQPELSQIATAVGMSEHHFQRIFTLWAGVSPKRFLQYITKERAKQALAESDNLLDAALETGLSGTGRLHDLLVTCEAMSPGEIKRLGADLTIKYGLSDSPFGPALLAWTSRGVCALDFIESGFEEQVESLKKEWPRARFQPDTSGAEALCSKVFSGSEPDKPVHLCIKGTNFQIKVWQALINSQPACFSFRITKGATCCGQCAGQQSGRVSDPLPQSNQRRRGG